MKADLAILRAEHETKMAEHKASVIRWIFGIISFRRRRSSQS
jgi:hypothetical protein